MARAIKLSPSGRVLALLWCLFALLVALRIHGSSLAYLTVHAPDTMGEHPPAEFLLAPAARFFGVENEPLARSLFDMQPRQVRIDEWAVFSPWALSQLTHDPPFPVVNDNVGAGQNMLLGFSNPVLHPTLVSRPSTWGFFLLGAERGLAWEWWFPVFACFTVLFLAFERLLEGERGLAAFGAFWFCGSAYVAAWSLWPAYAVFFPCLLCLAAHRLLTAPKRLSIALAALLIALGLPGFAMCSYPPWQVPLGWLFLLLFGWLCQRDGAFRGWPADVRFRAGAFVASLAVAAALIALYLRDAMPAIRAMMGTVYPGSRFHAGGDYGFVWLLRGYYNAWTNYRGAGAFHNESEAASFLHMFPAVLLVVLVSGKRRRALGGLGWLLLGYLVFALVYCLVGFPRWLAAITLMSRSHPPRVDIAIGLVSILLCLLLLRGPRALEPSRQDAGGDSLLERRAPWLVAGGVAVIVLAHGLAMHAYTGSYPVLPVAIVASGAVAAVSYALVAGHRRVFVALTSVAVVGTSGTFNPLAVGTAAVQQSEIVSEAARLDRAAPSPPLWLCYEPPELLSSCGAVLSLAGARSLTGIQQYPHLDVWHRLDPDGRADAAYNRYAHVELIPCAAPSCLEFEAPGDAFWSGAGLPPNVFHVKISPRHPALAALGARYVVAVGALQDDSAFSTLTRVYRSTRGGFSIFDLSPESPAD